MVAESDSLGAAAWRVVLGVAVAVTAATLVGLATAVLQHNSRLAVIESNRFTDQDAMRLERRILEALPQANVIMNELEDVERRLNLLERNQ